MDSKDKKDGISDKEPRNIAGNTSGGLRRQWLVSQEGFWSPGASAAALDIIWPSSDTEFV